MTSTAQGTVDPLVGLDLGKGWVIYAALPRAVAATGGNFSLGYLARNLDGREGFVKVINYQAVFWSPDMTAAMQSITEAYNFERELAEKCTSRRLSRVVRAYHHDNIRRPAPELPVSFIIFERADGDIRGLLDEAGDLELAVRLRMLHNAAAGIAQLHSIQVAHQDIKPSNLLVFKPQMAPGRSAKIGDLGRATDRNRAAVHDNFSIAGDPTYAPPEQRFREIAPSFEQRRLACDIYQLGNLLTFVLTGVTMNLLMHQYLDPSHSPDNWQGSYGDALPYVQAAHSAALEELEGYIPAQMQDRIVKLISATTDPDVARRGFGGRGQRNQQYAVNRIVTELDLLVRRVESRSPGAAA